MFAPCTGLIFGEHRLELFLSALLLAWAQIVRLSHEAPAVTRVFASIED